MEAYSALAPYYDEFNRDVPYDDILRFYKRLFTLADVSPQLVLEIILQSRVFLGSAPLRGFYICKSKAL